MTDFASFVGSALLLIFSVVGAYVTLRWGCVGISLLWRVREFLDEETEAELKQVVGMRRKP
jgi:hypothetical protein